MGGMAEADPDRPTLSPTRCGCCRTSAVSSPWRPGRSPTRRSSRPPALTSSPSPAWGPRSPSFPPCWVGPVKALLDEQQELIEALAAWSEQQRIIADRFAALAERNRALSAQTMAVLGPLLDGVEAVGHLGTNLGRPSPKPTATRPTSPGDLTARRHETRPRCPSPSGRSSWPSCGRVLGRDAADRAPGQVGLVAHGRLGWPCSRERCSGPALCGRSPTSTRTRPARTTSPSSPLPLRPTWRCWPASRRAPSCWSTAGPGPAGPSCWCCRRGSSFGRPGPATTPARSGIAGPGADATLPRVVPVVVTGRS